MGVLVVIEGGVSLGFIECSYVCYIYSMDGICGDFIMVIMIYWGVE